ncbi:polysaccharide biosynthesis protein [Xylanibacter ruminicola]|uniref:Polysaccharide biosynthesis protein n=1 Tax=Xylanibacter ruminicola TaxID=839 RepID=A0A1M6RWI0_XYLRU|nr:polysaccharide biosynthesis protein [Xylanibacter ruminicola]SHK36864.1 Polysaccharide biosynthesis protein [Xylanibacter ruminicola]
MFNLDQFIADYVTKRPASMFVSDIETNKEVLLKEIKGKKICVIGGAGSIGSSFIKAVLRFEPKSVVVVDLNENGLAELVRDVRSTYGLYVPDEFRCYTLNFADPIFEHIFKEEKGFDIVANFSAHKHVRSEKDRYSVQALIENNDIKAKRLMDLLKVYPPRHFFCVSTDKAANPVNIMGASKRIMEDLVMAYNQYFKVTTARFANVAFSNGSLPDGWLHRLQKRQPLAAPSDVKRYFVSPEESGQICMLACILGKKGEVFFPKLREDQMLTFSAICDDFISVNGMDKDLCLTDEEAKAKAANLNQNSSDGEVGLQKYPAVYFNSDTTGEKAYEEFYVPGEKIDMQRFQTLGVIEQTTRHDMQEVDSFFSKLEAIFMNPDFTKEQVVDAIREFIPTFEHEEKGKNLDQKM